MKTKIILTAAGLIVAICCIVAGLESREPAQEATQLENKPKPVVAAPQAEDTAVVVKNFPAEKNVAPSETAPPSQPVKAVKNVGAVSPPPVAANGVGDPLARAALSFVGADPDAEAY